MKFRFHIDSEVGGTLTVLVAALVLMAMAVYYENNQRIERNKNLESSMFVEQAIVPDLEEFYRSTGNYPHSLRELPEYKPFSNPLAINDRFVPFSADFFSYSTGSQIAKISWRGENDNQLNVTLLRTSGDPAKPAKLEMAF
jgi:hypothetical protein